MTTPNTQRDAEPRWPALLALGAIGALEFVMPRGFALGQPWLLLTLLVVLAVPASILRLRGFHEANEIVSYGLNGIVTLALIWTLEKLVRALLSHGMAPQALLGVAAALWISNVLVFAAWYWRLDAGGPRARDLRETHTEGAFLFPQMTMRPQQGTRGWSPGFVDYLFLAFNTSTAFSPTDAPVLSRWAKALMMVQASISLVTIALLAARAVNIL